MVCAFELPDVNEATDVLVEMTTALAMSKATGTRSTMRPANILAAAAIFSR